MSKAPFRLSRRQNKTAWFYIFVSPWLLGLVFLTIFPVAIGLLTSFTNYDGLNLPNVRWVGLRNYNRAFTVDQDALFSFRQTLRWTALNLPAWMSLSFILALILNQDVKGRGFFRTAYYLPSVMPAVALVWVWRIILDRNVGLLNAFISLFRPNTAIPWLTTYALPGLTMIAVWTGLGWGMVIFLAALQGIPDELVEAARIDGASNLRIFRHITLPLMTPVIFFVLINGLVSSFQQYVLPQLLTAGAQISGVPPRSVYLSLTHVNLQFFAFQRFGYGTALLWLLFVAIVVITIAVFKTQRFWVYSEADQEGK
jgi:ABC-type sugar transport system permease subunit